MLVLCTDASKGATTVKDEPSELGRAHWVFLFQLNQKTLPFLVQKDTFEE